MTSGGTFKIEIDTDEGSAEGYKVDSSEDFLPDWLTRHGFPSDALLAKIRKSYSTVAFMDSLAVCEHHRGNGKGVELVEKFHKEATANGAEAIFLVADLMEEQTVGFDLVEWYERRGYQIIKEARNGPLLFKKLKTKLA